MEALRSVGPANSPTVTDAQFTVLEEELSKGPPAHAFDDERWTLARVQTVIRRRLRVGLSVATVWRLLKRHGWSWQAPVRRALERDEHAVELWKKRERVLEVVGRGDDLAGEPVHDDRAHCHERCCESGKGGVSVCRVEDRARDAERSEEEEDRCGKQDKDPGDEAHECVVVFPDRVHRPGHHTGCRARQR
ncbi:helix-turn-helix domain-containing protein [Streptomyces zaomyceticus]|uniref:helix-turn-helix domain-containing protein n=1 Tax=Streptomyces zaomyceticus TaxID=68286 RepID=UPI0039908F8C